MQELETASSSGSEQGSNSAQAKDSPTAQPAPANVAVSMGMRLLEGVVHLVRDKNGSDIHLLEGEPPRIRIQGELFPLDIKDHPLVTRQDIEDVLAFALTPDQRKTFEETADIDFSLDFREATGRVNVGLANGRRMYLIMRYLRANIIPIEKLGIEPEMLKKIATSEAGLIIVAGETSSGKTTTIAAMLDHINQIRFGAINTIENPVEYVFRSQKCLITRREIGRDTPDFHTALRASVRKNPDVLLIGEVRDEETANIALTAAETGIQTFCTLHAIGSIPAISRLKNMLSKQGRPDAEFHIRLAHSLRAIISQQLLKAVDGKGVIPLYEILNMTYAEKNYLRDGDFERLEKSLESDHNMSMGHCLYNLWHQEPRRINEDTMRKLYGDQYNLMMNRLNNQQGWKPVLTSM